MTTNYSHASLDLTLPAHFAPRTAKRTWRLTIDDQEATSCEPFFAVKVQIDPSLLLSEPYTTPALVPYTDLTGATYMSVGASYPLSLCIDSGQKFGANSAYAGQPIINPTFISFNGETSEVMGVGYVSTGRDVYGTLWVTDSSVQQVIAYGGDITNNQTA